MNCAQMVVSAEHFIQIARFKSARSPDFQPNLVRRASGTSHQPDSSLRSPLLVFPRLAGWGPWLIGAERASTGHETIPKGDGPLKRPVHSGWRRGCTRLTMSLLAMKLGDGGPGEGQGTG
ncbi:hypothetical protein CGCTS75_v003358 [Colletotrichum tropicale]|nr:hypothetical protein CGCTS75_v003358 [Colletotrichum tropicale]